MISIDYSIIIVVLNFILLLIVLKKLLYKPLDQFLSAREEKITGELKQSAARNAEAEALLAQQKQLLQDARKQARTIREEAESHAKIQGEKILAHANEQRAHVIKDAQQTIDAEIAKAKNTIEQEIGELVVSLTDRVIGKKLSPKEDIALIQSLIDDEHQKEQG